MINKENLKDLYVEFFHINHHDHLPCFLVGEGKEGRKERKRKKKKKKKKRRKKNLPIHVKECSSKCV